jgi:hypothetical protein
MGLIGLNLGDMTRAEILLMIASAMLVAPFGALVFLVCHWRNKRSSVVLLPPERYTDLPLTNQTPTERDPDHDPQGLPADR